MGLERSILWSARTSSVDFAQCWICILNLTNEVLYHSGGVNTSWSNLWGQAKLVQIFFVLSVQTWWHEWSSSLHHVIKDTNVILKYWTSHDSTSPQLNVSVNQICLCVCEVQAWMFVLLVALDAMFASRLENKKLWPEGSTSEIHWGALEQGPPTLLELLTDQTCHEWSRRDQKKRLQISEMCDMSSFLNMRTQFPLVQQYLCHQFICCLFFFNRFPVKRTQKKPVHLLFWSNQHNQIIFTHRRPQKHRRFYIGGAENSQIVWFSPEKTTNMMDDFFQIALISTNQHTYHCSRSCN